MEMGGIPDERDLPALRQVDDEPLAARCVSRQSDHAQRTVVEEVGVTVELEVLEAARRQVVGQRIPPGRPPVRPPGVPQLVVLCDVDRRRALHPAGVVQMEVRVDDVSHVRCPSCSSCASTASSRVNPIAP